MLAAADAGILTLLMTNPIWVVKTRLCLQYVEDKNLAESKRYTGVTDALLKIYRTEGIRGLYKVYFFLSFLYYINTLKQYLLTSKIVRCNVTYLHNQIESISIIISNYNC